MSAHIYRHQDPVIVARDAHIEALRRFDKAVDYLTELQLAVAADEQLSAEEMRQDAVGILARRSDLAAAERESAFATAEEAAWDGFETVEIATAEGALAFCAYAKLHSDREGNGVLLDRAFAHMACVLAAKLPTFGRLAVGPACRV